MMSKFFTSSINRITPERVKEIEQQVEEDMRKAEEEGLPIPIPIEEEKHLYAEELVELGNGELVNFDDLPF